MSVCLCVCLSVCLSVYLSVFLSVSVCLFVCLFWLYFVVLVRPSSPFRDSRQERLEHVDRLSTDLQAAFHDKELCDVMFVVGKMTAGVLCCLFVVVSVCVCFKAITLQSMESKQY